MKDGRLLFLVVSHGFKVLKMKITPQLVVVSGVLYIWLRLRLVVFGQMLTKFQFCVITHRLLYPLPRGYETLLLNNDSTDYIPPTVRRRSNVMAQPRHADLFWGSHLINLANHTSI